MQVRVAMLLISLGLMVGCKKESTNAAGTESAPAATASTAKLTVTSSALTEGQPMPKAYACNDEKHRDTSPPLAWTKGPEGTEFYAIEMLDLDAPNVPNAWDKETKNFLHWRLLNVPPTVLSIAPSTMPPPNTGIGVENHFGTPVYGGPCPPPGAPAHHYTITVYAMKKKQPINTSIAKADVLASGTLTVTYAR